MTEVKLLDLNNDWKQVRPSLKKIDDNWYSIAGYQNYNISKKDIIPTSENTKIKFNLIQKYIKDDVFNKSVIDIGCSNMFFGFFAHINGAKNVAGIDLDLEYLNQNNKIINHLSFNDISCINKNVTDCTDVYDTVIAFAIIHWIYSCSGFMGSLENIINHFRKMTKNCLYIEWIDPSDDCIADMLHHLDFNSELSVKDYNKDNFLKYLKEKFINVDFLGFSKNSKTREIYRCK